MVSKKFGISEVRIGPLQPYRLSHLSTSLIMLDLVFVNILYFLV